MTLLKKLIPLVLVPLCVLLVLAMTFGVVIVPGETGVRQITIGPNRGFTEVGLSPGYHWRIPWYSGIHKVPLTVQILNFQREGEKAERSNEYNYPSLEIETSDRATIDLDVTVLARFYRSAGQEGEVVHGGPRDLLTIVGLEPDQWGNKISRVAYDALKRTLGTLSTAQFYDPTLREGRIEDGLAIMNRGLPDQNIKGLAEEGIKVEAVLLRRYTYREDRIENAIFLKNLQDQEEALSVAEGKLAEAQALTSSEEGKGDALKETLKVDGENQVIVKRSEASLYQAQKRAEGDLLVSRAEAESDRLRAEALIKGKATQAYVARELTPLVAGVRGGIITGIDPLDLGQWAKKLGSGE
jgi:regulator of protease activity HflC (stomatin/prohibitin superfamily)